MGKDLHYSILRFFKERILHHGMVESYEDISTNHYYKYRLKRRKGFSDIVIVLDDNYHFGEMGMYEAVSELPEEGGIILIAKPETSFPYPEKIQDGEQKIFISKIGPVMGALHKNEFWNYEPPKKDTKDKSART